MTPFTNFQRSPRLQAMPTIRRPTWEGRIALKNAFVHKLERAKRYDGSYAGLAMEASPAARRTSG